PILAPPQAVARVEGEIDFDELRFLPGRLAEDLLSVLPVERRPMLVLRHQVVIRIAEGKVHQTGLVVPVGRVAEIGLEGSVDFDKRLDLVARLAVKPPRADAPALAAMLQSARLEVPIRGTLENPQIDVSALKARLKSIGSDLLETAIGAGAE